MIIMICDYMFRKFGFHHGPLFYKYFIYFSLKFLVFSLNFPVGIFKINLIEMKITPLQIIRGKFIWILFLYLHFKFYFNRLIC